MAFLVVPLAGAAGQGLASAAPPAGDPALQEPSPADRAPVILPTAESRRGVAELPEKTMPDFSHGAASALAQLHRVAAAATAFSDTYALDDGSDHVVAVSPEPVNYENAAGVWMPIDPTLVSDPQGGWRNTADSIVAHLPRVLSASAGVNVELGWAVSGLSRQRVP